MDEKNFQFGNLWDFQKKKIGWECREPEESQIGGSKQRYERWKGYNFEVVTFNY